MKISANVLIAAVVLNSLAFAQEVTKVGTTAFGFLNVDVGSRAAAMGGAYVSIAQDATAMFWNPSGIARIDKFQAVFHHSSWIADLSLNYIAAVIPVGGFGNVGVNATSLTMDEMERTTRANPQGTGETFSAGSYAVGLSYARALTDRFSIGFNAKYINESIYNSSAQSAAFDVGLLFTSQLNDMKIGMSISNYGPKARMSGRDLLTQVDIDPNVHGSNENLNADLITDDFDLPLMFRVGLSMDVLKGAGNSNLIVAVDALHPNDDVESLNLGVEYGLNQMLFLRGGYASAFAEDAEVGFSLGGGVDLDISDKLDMSLDYAYKDFGLLNNVQMFTFALKF